LADMNEVLPPEFLNGTKSGYKFTFSRCSSVIVNGSNMAFGYTITAVPVVLGQTGVRGFCTDENGQMTADPIGGSNCTEKLE
jgi:type IV pilus assembly protein PilA